MSHTALHTPLPYVPAIRSRVWLLVELEERRSTLRTDTCICLHARSATVRAKAAARIARIAELEAELAEAP